jgi:hypothetical protein
MENIYNFLTPKTNEKELELINKDFNNSEIIPSTINSTKYLPKEHIVNTINILILIT